MGENCLSACNGIVMQSTNRFDVENNPIFEGDIVEVLHTNGRKSEYECIWDEHNLGFELISATRDGDEFGVYTLNFNQRNPKKMRIVRNIYEGQKS